MFERFDAFIDSYPKPPHIFIRKSGERSIVTELLPTHGQIVFARSRPFARNASVQSMTPIQ